MTIVDIPSIGITQLSMFDASIVGSSRLGSSSWSVVKSHVPWWFYGYYPILSKISGSYQNPSESTGKSVATRQEVNEGCVEEWSAQLGEALELLRSLRPQGAKVNVSCQMGPLVLGGPGWMGLGKHEGPDWPEMATFSKTNGCEATCIVVRRTMVPTRLSRALRIFQVIGDQKGWPHGFRVEGHLQIPQNSSRTPWKAPKIGGFVGRFVHPLKMSICLRFILSFQGILMDSTAKMPCSPFI